MVTQKPSSPANISADFIGSGFGQVDQQSDPSHYVRLLEIGNASEVVQLVRQCIFELLASHAGGRYLDVGCGTGDDTRALAQAVGPGGQVVGVDLSATMIAESRKRAAGLDLPVEYVQGSATRLDFADASFDGCMTQRLLLYLPDPRQALAEMVRVARSGAHIVAFEWDAESITPGVLSERALRRKFLDFVADSFPSGTIGRQLPRLLRELGLVEVAVDPVVSMQLGLQTEPDGQPVALNLLARACAAGALSQEEYMRAHAEVEAAINADVYFDASLWFLVSGRKP